MGNRLSDYVLIMPHYQMKTTDVVDVMTPEFVATVQQMATEFSTRPAEQRYLRAAVYIDISLEGKRDKTTEWYEARARRSMKDERHRRWAQYLSK